MAEVEGKQTQAALELAPELIPEGAGAVEVDALERPVEVELPAWGIAAVRSRRVRVRWNRGRQTTVAPF